MNNDEFLKKLLKEAEFDESPREAQATQAMLKKLLESAPVMSSAEAPVGYEAHLLNSLRAKLPPQIEAKSASKSRRQSAGFFDFLKSPQLSWGMAGGLALFIAVFAMTQYSGPRPGLMDGSNDLLVQMASRGGARVANEWLASVGDSGIRVQSGRGLSSLADELELEQNQDLVDQALNEVAKTLGMNKL